MINYAVSRIEGAIRANPLCSGGLFVQPKVFAINKGPSGDMEMLALIYADDPSARYWYAHLMRHPQKRGQFVSLIVWSERLVNASNMHLLFEHFHFLMKTCGAYQPCSIQLMDDAYAESGTLRAAITRLEIMIGRFDVDKRWPVESGLYADSPQEMRILEVYGMSDFASRM